MLFFGFFLVLICKQIKIYDFFDPHLLVDPASEKPGIEKSSISFKFLLKIDDFRRRDDSERPGIEKPLKFFCNLFEFFKGFQKDFELKN